MGEEILYPSEDELVKYNIFVLESIQAKKADKPLVLSEAKISKIIEECMAKEGDIYEKAVVLLKGLVKKHPFASGNRRTAFIATKGFLLDNSKRFNVADNPKYVPVMQGIREDYYSDEEIRGWIKDGKIREFKRQG